MSGLIGLNGLPISADDSATIDERDLHDENARVAEVAGETASDIDSTDELGVRYFYPLDWPDEALRGTKVPKRERERNRKEVLRQQRQWERHMQLPVKRHELEAMFQNSIAPMGRQIQTLTFQFMALRNILQRQLGISDDQIREETARVIREYREKSATQAAEQAKSAAEAVLTQARGDDNGTSESGASGGDGGPVPPLQEEA